MDVLRLTLQVDAVFVVQQHTGAEHGRELFDDLCLMGPRGLRPALTSASKASIVAWAGDPRARDPGDQPRERTDRISVLTIGGSNALSTRTCYRSPPRARVSFRFKRRCSR